MTAILSAAGQPSLAHQLFDPMAEGVSDAWRCQSYNPMPLPVDHYWPETHGTPMSGMHDTDLTMFQSDSAGNYQASYSIEPNPLMQTQIIYAADATWGSDMDVGTPSTAGFPTDVVDGYHNMRHTSNPSLNLNLAPTYERMSSSAHSPGSSHEGISPHQSYANPPHPPSIKEERPSLTRSITAPAAPNQRLRRSAALPSSTKRCGSDDEDDDYMPNCDDAAPKPRGRKRQRIPHTAVERRYRENLNAHLDKLRQAVPALASKPQQQQRGSGAGGGSGALVVVGLHAANKPADAAGGAASGGAAGEGAKPSKCEILNGALEHIGALAKENGALLSEVRALRLRLEDFELRFGRT